MAIRKISIGVVGGVIVIGLLAGAWFMLGGKPSSPSLQANEAAKIENETPPPDPTKHSYFEINFAKQMIIYNQQAVDLANIVQHGGSDKEVQDLAGEVIAAHGKAADQYATWLREWNETYLSLSDFPRSDDHDGYPTNPGMPRVVELDKMAAMSAAEKEKEFLRLILKLNEGVLEHINTTGDNIQYGEMKDYLATDKAHYSQEIKSIKDLRHARGQH